MAKHTCPRISIVTPSYNQGHFIEQTIESILDQNYPDLEYIIIDGGSTDNSLEVIRKYSQHLKYWISEPDRGQTHAINKGFEHASGDILAYLNSDDIYLPGAFSYVANSWSPNDGPTIYQGTCRWISEQGETTGNHTGRISQYAEILDLWNVWWGKRQFVQPEIFWNRCLAEKVGPFNEQLFYVMDYEYWMRGLRADACVKQINQELTAFRFTSDQKSNQSEQVARELLQVVGKQLDDSSAPINWWTRTRLKSWHVFDSRFRPFSSNLSEAGISKFNQYAKQAAFVFQNPTVTFCRAFWERLGSLPARKIK